MRKGEHFIVITHRGSRHPVGTEVVVTVMTDPARNERPYYCKAVQGNTEYWYSEDELTKEWKEQL